MIRTAFGVAAILSFLAILGDGYSWLMFQPMDAGYDEWRQQVGDELYAPPGGMVPDAKTAVAIADAVLRPIYGADTIWSERPFHARLHGNRWVVQGTFWCFLCFGGTAIIEINKADGRILFVTHGK